MGAEGIVIRDRAEHLRKQGHPHEAERLLSDFAALHATDAPGPLLAHIYNDLGALWQDQHRFPEAYRCYKRSVDEWERSGEKYRLHAATGLNNLAAVLWDDGRLSDAYKALARSAAIQIEVAGPFSPELMQLYYNQGVLSMALNRFAEAEEDYRKFLRITPQPADPAYLLRSALVHSDLGRILRRNGRTAEAAHEFAQSRQTWNQWRGERNIEPVLLLNLAASFWNTGSVREAAEAVKVALDASESAAGAASASLVRALQLQAKILRATKRKAEARAAELRAREIQLMEGSARPAANDRIDIAALQSVIASRREPRR